MNKTNPFSYCPQCGSEKIRFNAPKFHCFDCNFVYFHNVATSVCVVIKHGGKLLFTRRAKDPKKDLLDLPGGFVDAYESAEKAAIREVSEELGFTLTNLRYRVTYPNQYLYKNINYNTCDIAFESEFFKKPLIVKKLSEIKEVVWLGISELNIEDVAFDSIKNLLIDHYGLIDQNLQQPS